MIPTNFSAAAVAYLTSEDDAHCINVYCDSDIAMCLLRCIIVLFQHNTPRLMYFEGLKA